MRAGEFWLRKMEVNPDVYAIGFDPRPLKTKLSEADLVMKLQMHRPSKPGATLDPHWYLAERLLYRLTVPGHLVFCTDGMAKSNDGSLSVMLKPAVRATATFQTSYVPPEFLKMMEQQQKFLAPAEGQDNVGFLAPTPLEGRETSQISANGTGSENDIGSNVGTDGSCSDSSGDGHSPRPSAASAASPLQRQRRSLSPVSLDSPVVVRKQHDGDQDGDMNMPSPLQYPPQTQYGSLTMDMASMMMMHDNDDEEYDELFAP